MPRTASFLSGAGSTASWRKKEGEATPPKNRHNNIRSLEKEHLCQHYYPATSPSWLHVMVLFQYSHTAHSSMVPRTLQSKTSSWLDSKERLPGLWSGSTKKSNAKGERSARGPLPPCPVLFHWYVSFVRSQGFQVRRFSWNVTQPGHREGLTKEARFFSWKVLTLLQGRRSDGGFQNSCLPQGLIPKTIQKRYILNYVYIDSKRKPNKHDTYWMLSLSKAVLRPFTCYDTRLFNKQLSPHYVQNTVTGTGDAKMNRTVKILTCTELIF